MIIVKKSFSLFFVLLLLVSFFTLAPISANAETSGDYEYAFVGDGTVKITKYIGSDSEVTIPNVIDGYTVSRVGFCAFINCESVTEVTISDGITAIDTLAFYNCSNLKTISISDSVIDISLSAFDGTAYYKDEDNWEENVLYIGKHLIKAKDSISGDYNIKDGTVCVAGYAFQYCENLSGIVFPVSLKGIGNMAFGYCQSLTSVEIPDSVVFLGDSAFSDCSNLKSAVLSKNINSINYHLFGYCDKLQSITIPDNVTSIGNYAFNSCTSITSITIPDGVTDIGNMAFYYCKNLNNIYIPNSVTVMGADVFTKTAYYKNEDNWKNNVLYIGKHLISANKKLSGTYTIKADTRSIASYAFEKCEKISSIAIPDGITNIGNYTFYECSKLKNINIPDSVISIGSQAFYGCKALTGILIPAGVTYIGENALGFYYGDNFYTKVKYFRIYGYKESAAKKYADENGFEFVNASSLPSSLKLASAKVSGVKNKTYNDKAQTQSVTVKSGTFTLQNGTDYTISYKNNKEAGKATLTITGSGIFTGTKTVNFTINKAQNPMTVKTKTITAKAKSDTSFAKSKAFTISKAQGSVSFKKSSGDKKITITKAGKITVKKGLKTGKTYKFKVKVTAAGNSNYKSGSKTATVKIKVK